MRTPWARLRRLIGLFAAACFVASIFPAMAAEPVVSPGATITLLEGRREANGILRLGLGVDLRPGWKTYWRSPGEGGFPPEINISGSTNIAEAQLRWPAPQRHTFLGFETIGYAEDLVLPLDVRLVDPAAPARLELDGALSVCSDICTRVEFYFVVELSPGGSFGDPAAAARIDAFQARVPGDGAAHGLDFGGVALVETPSGPSLRVVATSREGFVAPDLLVEADPPVVFEPPQLRFADERHRVEFTLRLAQPLPEGTSLADRSVVLTLVDGTRAAERSATVATAMPTEAGAGSSAAPDAGAARLFAMLATALLGGLVLNLMPCVLPVLSLKLLSTIGHGGAGRRAVRLGFLASAAGILTSFLALAAMLVALKATGAAVGWGIQFQQPLFLVLLVLLLTLFAANLLGLFEVVLPYPLMNAIGTLPGHGRSLAGHFTTGAFTTLLATPCSAPFLGTAVGFALGQGSLEILLIFTALGLGLALPYLMVALLPGTAAMLPRPGRWMQTLRRLLAIPLGLTTLWLLSVIAAQTGLMIALLIAALMVALLLMLWSAASGGYARGRLVAAVGAVAIAAFLAPLGSPSLATPAAPAVVPPRAAGLDWVPFNIAGIAERVAAGEVVFVEVTADWCITCKVNERLVLRDTEVTRRLASGGITPMLADWTRPDPVIASYLMTHGRYGIPFTAVYGPAAPDGIVLPELLSVARVLDALDAARGSRP